MTISGTRWTNFLRAFAVMTVLLFVAPNANAAVVSTIYQIPKVNDGASPIGPLTLLGGKYYGTTEFGGPGGELGGTIYTIDLTTGNDTVLYGFPGGNGADVPTGGLVAYAGKLYGVTSGIDGGLGGSVFEFDPATGAERIVYLPPAGTQPVSLVVYNGVIFGAGRNCGADGGEQAGAGCIFSVDPVAATGQIVYSFPTGGPAGGYPTGLIAYNGALYGTNLFYGAGNSGTLFKFDPATDTEQTLYHFGVNAGDLGTPSPLVVVNGIFYGTGDEGGAHDFGGVFSFNPATDQETVLYSFPAGIFPSEGLLSAGGLIYGTTFSTGASLYSIDPASGHYATVHDFTAAENYTPSDLTAANGLIYGSSPNGSVVYSVDPATGRLSVVHSFLGVQDSSTSGLIKVGPALYGVGSGSGTNALGSIFKVNPATGVGETVYSFKGADGSSPEGALIDVGGLLYGTTYGGGSSGFGTVFSFDAVSRKLVTIYSFTGGSDGKTPYCDLTLANNALFGTTTNVAGGYSGTVFKIDLGTLDFTTIFTFTPKSGVNTYSGLVLANGKLYGTAHDDGAQHSGTIYSIDPSTGAEETLYSFLGGADGGGPVASLVLYNGLLIGSTSYERHASSTIFTFDPTTRSKTILHTFASRNIATLILAGDSLYGTFHYGYNGGLGDSAIIRVNPATGAVKSYNLAGGYVSPVTSPLLHVGNMFYGTTGAYYYYDTNTSPPDEGAVFSFKP